MTTLLQFRTRARALLQERTERLILDTDLTTWVNAGVKDFSTRVLWYERVVAQAVTAYKGEYTLPTDILKLILARWQNKYRMKVVDLSEWSAATYYNTNPTGIPSIASLSPHDTILRLWAPPSSSSPTTTISGEGSVSAVATTIPVVSTASFPRSGKIIINGEQIHYDNTDSTNFLLCRRGDGDTTAAIQGSGSTVTEGTLVLTTAAIPPTVSADADIVKFPVQWEDALVYYLASFGELVRQDHKKADSHLQKYLQRREEAALEKFWNVLDGSPGVKDEEYEMGQWGIV